MIGGLHGELDTLGEAGIQCLAVRDGEDTGGRIDRKGAIRIALGDGIGQRGLGIGIGGRHAAHSGTRRTIVPDTEPGRGDDRGFIHIREIHDDDGAAAQRRTAVIRRLDGQAELRCGFKVHRPAVGHRDLAGRAINRKGAENTFANNLRSFAAISFLVRTLIPEIRFSLSMMYS